MSRGGRKYPAEFWEHAQEHRKIFEQKLCVAVGFGACAGAIVRAHTIPRSQLALIARDGHVQSFKAAPTDLAQNGGKISPKEFGINQFSVLNCFCAGHDKSLFQPIEDEPLRFSPQQIALLHFRAMALEFYKKSAGLLLAQANLRKLTQKRYVSREKVDLSQAYVTGSELGLRDITKSFKECEEGVYGSSYDKFSALVVLFEKVPTIMTVGGFAPEFSFRGDPLERSQLGKISGQGTTHASLSILCSDGRAAVVLAWLASARSSRAFADSYLAQRSDLYSTLAIQAAFEYIENTCIDPAWWKSLAQLERDALARRMQSGMPFGEDRPNTALTYCGVTFDDWKYRSHKFVN
jgi:hypothetical protein